MRFHDITASEDPGHILPSRYRTLARLQLASFQPLGRLKPRALGRVIATTWVTAYPDTILQVPGVERWGSLALGGSIDPEKCRSGKLPARMPVTVLTLSESLGEANLPHPIGMNWNKSEYRAAWK